MPKDAYEIAILAAVHHFAATGEARLLEALLEKHPKLVDVELKFVGGPRKPDPSSHYHPLHRAAEGGHAGVVRLLLAKGANPNGDGGLGWTPLHVASQAGQLEIVKLLVEKDSDIRALTQALPETTPPGASSAIPGQQPRPLAREKSKGSGSFVARDK